MLKVVVLFVFVDTVELFAVLETFFEELLAVLTALKLLDEADAVSSELELDELRDLELEFSPVFRLLVKLETSSSNSLSTLLPETSKLEESSDTLPKSPFDWLKLEESPDTLPKSPFD
jgi:hypothetical protein